MRLAPRALGKGRHSHCQVGVKARPQSRRDSLPLAQGPGEAGEAGPGQERPGAWVEGARGQSPWEGRSQQVSRQAALKPLGSPGCEYRGKDGKVRAKVWAECWEGRKAGQTSDQGLLRGFPTSHPSCLGWKRHMKGTPGNSQGKCVWLCYGNRACVYRIWQPGLGLGLGTWGTREGLTGGLCSLQVMPGAAPGAPATVQPAGHPRLRGRKGRGFPSHPRSSLGQSVPNVWPEDIYRAVHPLAGSACAVQGTPPHLLPRAIRGAALRWGSASSGHPTAPSSGMASLGHRSTGCQPRDHA